MPIGINKVDGSMHVLFQKNQPLPDYKTRTLTTSKDNLRSIMLKIYQGESKLIVENELLGTFVFSGLREAPKGAVKVEVTFHIDSEGILNLTARDQTTGQLVESRLKLGKDDADKKDAGGARHKKKKVKKEDKEEPVTPPPMPLVMPSSQLQARPTPSTAPTPQPLGLTAAATGASATPIPISQRGGTPVPISNQLLQRTPRPVQRVEGPKGPFQRLVRWFLRLFGRE
jgi:hypothetical protein